MLGLSLGDISPKILLLVHEQRSEPGNARQASRDMEEDNRSLCCPRLCKMSCSGMNVKALAFEQRVST